MLLAAAPLVFGAQGPATRGRGRPVLRIEVPQTGPVHEPVGVANVNGVADGELLAGAVDRAEAGPAVAVRAGHAEDVAALMESKTRGFSEPPDVPDEILNKEQGEEFYEFDEEDAAGEGSD